MLESTFMPKIGVDEFWFALLDKDKPGDEPVYQKSVKVPGTVSVGFNPNSQTGTFYADNGPYVSAAQTGDLVATVGLADIPPEVRAVWFRQDYEDGILSEGQIKPPDMAVGYRVKKANNAYRYIWLLKGKAAPPSETTNTKNNSISFQSDSITINCAMLISKGIYRRVLDEDDPNLPDGVTPKMIAETWFTDPMWVPTI